MFSGVTDVEKSPTSPDFEAAVQIQPTKHNKWSPASDEFDFGLDEAKPEGAQSQTQIEPEEDTNDWAKFQALTSGVDDIVKQKKEELDSLKVSSYYQRKKTQDEIQEDARLARPKNLVGKRKKKWVDLDQEGFEEKEGVIVEDVSDADLSEDEDEEEDEEFQFVEEEKQPTPPEEEVPEEKEEEEKDEEDKEEEEEDDIFDTEFVDETLAVLDLKLNEIPDSPIDDGPDVFDTKFASEIVEKAEKARARAEKAESDKIKFGCISAAADVLTGKASQVDKQAVEQTVRKRSRRANRINLIGEEAGQVTSMEEMEGSGDNEPKEATNLLEAGADLEMPVDDLLSTTPSPGLVPTTAKPEPSQSASAGVDLSEFEERDLAKENAPLTSNIALLEAEFNEAPEEEDDPFDAAFDELAKESLTKVTLEEITADLFNDDLFDTTAADDVLNLASLTNVVNKKEEEEEEILETFDDKDPFDTSVYDHITKDFEDDLGFESLAKRDPNETVTNVADDLGKYKERVILIISGKVCFVTEINHNHYCHPDSYDIVSNPGFIFKVLILSSLLRSKPRQAARLTAGQTLTK